jgi:hypothetical protein
VPVVKEHRCDPKLGDGQRRMVFLAEDSTLCQKGDDQEGNEAQKKTSRGKEVPGGVTSMSAPIMRGGLLLLEDSAKTQEVTVSV